MVSVYDVMISSSKRAEKGSMARASYSVPTTDLAMELA
jgi:hypothetical protein